MVRLEKHISHKTEILEITRKRLLRATSQLSTTDPRKTREDDGNTREKRPAGQRPECARGPAAQAGTRTARARRPWRLPGERAGPERREMRRGASGRREAGRRGPLGSAGWRPCWAPGGTAARPAPSRGSAQGSAPRSRVRVCAGTDGQELLPGRELASPAMVHTAEKHWLS